MTAPRLKMETGIRDEDVRDDTPKGGLFHRTPSGFRRHPTHPVNHICKVCGVVVHAETRDKHAAIHRWEEEWQDKVEFLEEKLSAAETRIERLEAQHALIAETFGHALAPLVEQNDAAS